MKTYAIKIALRGVAEWSGVAYVGGLSFCDDAHLVFIDDFAFDVGDRCTYEYNFFDSWLHDIQVEAIEMRVTSPMFPFCVKGNGMPGATRYDEVERTMDLIKAIIDSDESTKVSDIRDQIEALDGVRFNRKKVNHRLTTLSDWKGIKWPWIGLLLIWWRHGDAF